MVHKIMRYAKSIAGLIGAVLTSVIAVTPDAPLWLIVLSAAVTAVAVYVIPNEITRQQLEKLEDTESADH